MGNYSATYMLVQKAKNWLRALIAQIIHAKNTIKGFSLRVSSNGLEKN